MFKLDAIKIWSDIFKAAIKSIKDDLIDLNKVVADGMPKENKNKKTSKKTEVKENEDVTKLLNGLNGIYTAIKNINNNTIKIDDTSFENLNNQLQEIVKQMDLFKGILIEISNLTLGISGIGTSLSQLSDMLKVKFELFDENDINKQFERVKSKFNEITNGTGKYDGRKKGILDSVFSEYDKYIKMGGKLSAGDIDDTQSEKLLKSYEKYNVELDKQAIKQKQLEEQKKIQSENEKKNTQEAITQKEKQLIIEEQNAIKEKELEAQRQQFLESTKETQKELQDYKLYYIEMLEKINELEKNYNKSLQDQVDLETKIRNLKNTKADKILDLGDEKSKGRKDTEEEKKEKERLRKKKPETNPEVQQDFSSQINQLNSLLDGKVNKVITNSNNNIDLNRESLENYKDYISNINKMTDVSSIKINTENGEFSSAEIRSEERRVGKEC